MKCNHCNSPIAKGRKVCGTCASLKREAYHGSVYTRFVRDFALKDSETPQQFHARCDTALSQLLEIERARIEARRVSWSNENYKRCDMCGAWGNAHERYCDEYIPQIKKGKR